VSTRVPRQSHVYKGALADSTRWSSFEKRPGDIFVCTPPKCGTTWTQAICALLVFQTPDLPVNPAEISPWFDMALIPLDETVALLEGQTHRRIIKTHTPLDGIPYYEDCSYVCVYRDPRDVFFSLRNHLGNMKFELPGDGPQGETRERFRAWIEAEYEPGSSETFSIRSFVHHFNTFRTFEDLNNIALFHYADLKRDLPGGMGHIARHLGIPVERTLLAKLAETAGFDNMKQNATRFAPGANRDMWHDTERFFNKGTSGQWRDEVSDEDDRRFRAALAGLLPPDEARWLLEGSPSGTRDRGDAKAPSA
jgi:hypothetical protein